MFRYCIEDFSFKEEYGDILLMKNDYLYIKGMLLYSHDHRLGYSSIFHIDDPFFLMKVARHTKELKGEKLDKFKKVLIKNALQV